MSQRLRLLLVGASGVLGQAVAAELGRQADEFRAALGDRAGSDRPVVLGLGLAGKLMGQVNLALFERDRLRPIG